MSHRIVSWTLSLYDHNKCTDDTIGYLEILINNTGLILKITEGYSPTVGNSDRVTRLHGWGPTKQDKILFITKTLTILVEKNAHFNKKEKNDCNLSLC